MAHETVAALLVVMVFSWAVGVVFSRGNSDKEMLDEGLFVGCASVRSIVGAMDISS